MTMFMHKAIVQQSLHTNIYPKARLLLYPVSSVKHDGIIVNKTVEQHQPGRHQRVQMMDNFCMIVPP